MARTEVSEGEGLPGEIDDWDNPGGVGVISKVRSGVVGLEWRVWLGVEWVMSTQGGRNLRGRRGGM